MKVHQPRGRGQSIGRGYPAQFIPRPSANWIADPHYRERFEERIRRHNAAETELTASIWGRELLPLLRPIWGIFWDDAIDEALGKAAVAQAKRFMRQKGRFLHLCKIDGFDATAFLAACETISGILASLRVNGRPSKAPFDDMVSSGYLWVRTFHSGDRVPRLDPLRRFFELPELGYALRPRDMSRIAWRVSSKVRSGESHDMYPRTAFLWSILAQRQNWGFTELTR